MKRGGKALGLACFGLLALAVPANAVLIAAAGDIACRPGYVGIEQCRQVGTSKLLARADAVLALGDTQYEDGLTSEYSVYDASWGNFFQITRPIPGNHEYHSGNGAAGYFSYFGAAAGDPSLGYYSYDLGTWHLIALNSSCEHVDCTAENSWLASDLAAHPAACTLAYWHHPLFSSGREGGSTRALSFWQTLYDHRADVVLSAHDHDYERFAPQGPGGIFRDHGPREFVVGTGGRSLRGWRAIQPNSKVRSNHFGVLRMDLRPGYYSWRFVITKHHRVRDRGSARCVGSTAG